MAYTKYSLTPANNNAAPPDGAPEGMLPSAVNDTMRDMMAQIRDVGDGIRGGTYTMTAPVITGGSITGVALSGNTFTNPVITGGSINNTPIGATTASTGRFSDLTDTGLTSGRVIYAGTGGNLVDDADFTFNGTTVTMANDASISGLTVGKGGGAVATNTALGNGALPANTSGSANTAVGGNVNYGVLRFNTTGANNSGFGVDALGANTTGSNNVAVGRDSLVSNTTASNNTAVGYQAGYSNTTAPGNVFIGTKAGFSDTTGNYNTCVGFEVGYNLTTGSGNTFIGGTANYPSGYYVTTGSKNTILGSYNGNQGGLDIRTANNYIVLSDGDGNPRGIANGGRWSFGGTTSDCINAYSTQTAGTAASLYTGYYGATNNGSGGTLSFNVTTNGNVTNTNGSYGTISDAKLKENIVDATPKLYKVNQLKVRNFNLIGSELKQIGFVAQEFEQVFPSMVEEHHDKDADGNDLGTTTKSIKTSVLVPILVKAVQELTAKVEALEAQLNNGA